MHQNSHSYKTKQANLLRSKTQSFLRNYDESFNRVKDQTTLHKLAKRVSSSKVNKQISPKKTAKNSFSLSNSMIMNPELSKSQIIKGLHSRVLHIPNYSDINTEMLQEKKELQDKIATLKDKINKQKKINDEVNNNCRKISNALQECKNSLSDLNKNSSRLWDNLNSAQNDCDSLSLNLKRLKSNNNSKMAQISEQQRKCQQLQSECKLLKGNVLIQERQRLSLKSQLIRCQKTMTSNCLQMKKLEDDRAVLLLEINRAVELNKLK